MGNPLDTDAVADLELGDGVVDGDDDTGTLVAGNAGAVGLEGPLVLDDVKVSLVVSNTSKPLPPTGPETEGPIWGIGLEWAKDQHLRGRHQSRGP